MGFLNPPVGNGGVLIRPAIHSPNYVPGVSGWSINKDGTAQFSQLTTIGSGFVANNQGQFFYAGTPALGNLIAAITGTNATGVDTYGNVYTPGGLCIIGNPLATSLFTVMDQSTPPNTIAGIASDGSFSTDAVVSAGTDMFVAGSSLLNDLIGPLPLGIVARTNVGAVNLPTVATSSEFYLYELDFQTLPFRSYMLMLAPLWLQFSGAGGCKINIYATTDGTDPTNASPVIMQGSVEASGTTGFSNIRSPTITKMFEPGGALWRILVSIAAFGTGATPTISLHQLDTNPGDETQVNARFYIYDMGITVPNTGRSIVSTGAGSGGGTSNYTKTYTCNGSHSYEGSDGGAPNNKINDNSTSYQGGDNFSTFNGKAKTWYTFNTTPITSDLSGATITKVEVYLNNNHTWYSGGMTAAIGYDSKSSFGATAGDPSGTGIDAQEVHFNEGQAKWVTVPNAFGTNFQSGAANTIVLFKNSNNLQFYGFFAGSGQNGPCQLRIHYTK
jgi:hypothetical protein